MRRDVQILLATACLGAVALWGERILSAIATMEAFQVRSVEVRGARFLSEQEVVGLLALTPESSIWSEIQPWKDHYSTIIPVWAQHRTRGLPKTPRELPTSSARAPHG